MKEVTSRDGLSDLPIVLPTTSDGELVPLHDLEELFPDILGSPHGSRLDVVLMAPNIREVILLPRFIHTQHGEMISLWLMESGFLLVGYLLLILGPIEDVGFC